MFYQYSFEVNLSSAVAVLRVVGACLNNSLIEFIYLNLFDTLKFNCAGYYTMRGVLRAWK